jgi:Transposase DDE domain group 1
MTPCDRTPIRFASLNHQQVVADFTGGTRTCDAGGLLLREVDRRLGLLDALDRAIPDPPDPAAITHAQRTRLAQRVFGIALGYEDLNDHPTLRDDALLQTVTGRGLDPGQPLASPPTLGRLENRLDRPSLVRIAQVFVETFIASHPTPPEELVLDFDATDDPVHGNQENRFFHGYYDSYCFLPLYVFCGSHLLVAYLRPAKIDAAKHAWAILGLLVKHFRQVWPEVRIVFRGDSGFCRWKMRRWCDRHGVGSLVGLARNPVLLRQAGPWVRQAEEQFAAAGDKQRLFGEFRYAAGTWDRERRVLVKAEHRREGPNTRFVVTNLEGAPPALYDGRYCPRGDMENRIKEQQLWLFAGRTSCHAFLANPFRVLLAAAAYLLVDHLRRQGRAGTELAQAQAGTIRLKLLKLGARVVASVRRVVVHLASGYPLQELFTQVAARLCALPPPVLPTG